MTVLEKFINEGCVEISAHPLTPSLRRMAVLEGGLMWYPQASQISLNYTVKYLSSEGEVLNDVSLGSYRVTLLVDNSTKINSSGFIVTAPSSPPEKHLDPEGVVTNQADIDAAIQSNLEYQSLPTSYESFLSLANSKTNIFQLMLDITLLRDSQGKFNI